ncbi:MAG TPA: type I DNA topoisomerase [Candidatus Paceibacterota bacterium]|nr:type I DNA topoisomerase [Candidatus Paceibacterota bacterium]
MSKTAKSLIIVESPTKAKTISQFLKDGYQIESSYGHVRDLPKSKLGIDVEHNFQPQYIIPRKAQKNVTKLKKLAAKAPKVILATDEDREGEAISWHLAQTLNLPDYERITFHEITPEAINRALTEPRKIDLHLVDAQQARRVLDRLVGYELSPFLWKKISRGLSAGRVQSVALRLIADREEERKKFQKEEYWTIDALLEKVSRKGQFLANLFKINEESLDKFNIKNEAEAKKISADLEKCQITVKSVEEKTVKKSPLPPFTTSTLQQEAWKKLYSSARQTMRFAQMLYEGVDFGQGQIGLITYMRTDSVNLSEQSLSQAQSLIQEDYGQEYALPSARRFKTKSKLAQEAHEAIRPTHPEINPSELKDKVENKLYKLYDLIWRRFIASQMAEATIKKATVELEAINPQNSYSLKTTGNLIQFDGFLKVYPLNLKEVEIPELAKGEKLKLLEIKPEQHFTEPPARYNEASLIKILEEYGIGRPSTYAPIISLLQFRRYIEKDESRRFYPTELGALINEVLVKHFPEIVNVGFTAKIEEDLDEIANGQKEWVPVVREFHEPFKKNLDEKYQEVSKKEIAEEKTDEVCEKCGKPMIIKMGRFGRFLACSGFPECKNAKSLNNNHKNPNYLNMKCPKCQEGEVVRRRSKKGRFFYGCSRWPQCDFVSWKKPGNNEDEE